MAMLLFMATTATATLLITLANINPLVKTSYYKSTMDTLAAR